MKFLTAELKKNYIIKLKCEHTDGYIYSCPIIVFSELNNLFLNGVITTNTFLF